MKKGGLHPKLWERLFERPDPPRPWALEVSGRLLSIVGSVANIAIFAEAKCEEKRRENPRTEVSYFGYANLPLLKMPLLGADYGVYHGPEPGDPAHANLVRRVPFVEVEPGVIKISEFRRLDSIIDFVAAQL